MRILLARVAEFFETAFGSRKTLNMLAVVMLALAIPLTIYVAQRPQDIRQRASHEEEVPTPTPRPTCSSSYPGAVWSSCSASCPSGTVYGGYWYCSNLSTSVQGTCSAVCPTPTLGPSPTSNIINTEFKSECNSTDPATGQPACDTSGNNCVAYSRQGTGVWVAAGNKYCAGCGTCGPTPTITPFATATPVPPGAKACNTSCTQHSECATAWCEAFAPAGSAGFCRNRSNPSATDCSAASPTPTIRLIATLTNTPTPTATGTAASGARLALTFNLSGIYANKTIRTPQRNILAEFYNASNTLVGSGIAQPTALAYNSGTGKFTGTISVSNIPNGSYTIKVKTDRYLKKILPDIITIASATQLITVPEITMIVGDINNDNTNDVSDYNVLVSCFATKATSTACGANKTNSDLDDDGDIDEVDYNILIRSFSNRRGD